jgi:hypothetical protein
MNKNNCKLEFQSYHNEGMKVATFQLAHGTSTIFNWS